MDLDTFHRALDLLTPADVRRLASDLAARSDSPADELATRRAVLGIEHGVRLAHRRAEAARASTAASQAVVAGAKRRGVPLPDPDVTRVARAAAQIARGLVVGGAVAAEVRFLAEGWQELGVVHGLAA